MLLTRTTTAQSSRSFVLLRPPALSPRSRPSKKLIVLFRLPSRVLPLPLVPRSLRGNSSLVFLVSRGASGGRDFGRNWRVIPLRYPRIISFPGGKCGETGKAARRTRMASYRDAYTTRGFSRPMNLSRFVHRARSNLCAYRILKASARPRFVSEISGTLRVESAETNGRTLIPALLNLLQRRNSRGRRRPRPPAAGPPASYQRAEDFYVTWPCDAALGYCP